MRSHICRKFQICRPISFIIIGFYGHQDDLSLPVPAFERVAPRNSRRPERGRTMEWRHGFCVLCALRRDGQQPPGRPRDQHALAAPDSELHGLHQHVDDSKTTGAAALARAIHTPRLRRADAPDLGACEPVWQVRSGHELSIGSFVIEVAAGDTTVGSTPSCSEYYPPMVDGNVITNATPSSVFCAATRPPIRVIWAFTTNNPKP